MFKQEEGSLQKYNWGDCNCYKNNRNSLFHYLLSLIVLFSVFPPFFLFLYIFLYLSFICVKTLNKIKRKPWSIKNCMFVKRKPEYNDWLNILLISSEIAIFQPFAFLLQFSWTSPSWKYQTLIRGCWKKNSMACFSWPHFL